MDNRPLSGIRVVELATFVAATSCGRLLADLGAEVIKVESPSGDGWRGTGKSYLARFNDDENPVFDIYNTGKKTLSLNLKDASAKEAFLKLLETADVFITNTRPAALKRLGLSYEDLKEKYPKLIYAIVLGYGEKGPDADRVAFDTTAFWSRNGFLRDLAVDGEDYSPVYPPSSVGDTVTGMFLMGEICAALFNRVKTGKGDYVRSCLYQNGIFVMGTMNIVTQKPFGRKYPAIRTDHGVPGGTYKCADGEWIYIGMGQAHLTIPKLHKLIGRPELDNEPKFQAANRWKNRVEYYNIFKEAYLTKTSDEWVKLGDELDIPLVKMRHFSDVTEDEQAWANGFLEKVEFPSGNVDVMPASPIAMNSVTGLKTVPTPPIGAHTKQLLEELGYSAEQVEAMLAAGAAVAAK